MRRRLFPVAGAILLLAALLVGAGPVNGVEAAGLPARNWNSDNLRQIEKAAISPPLTFAVLGDSRGNPQVFDRLLRQINDNPRIAFAIHVGDLVETGTIQNFRNFIRDVRPNLHKPLLTVIGNHELDGEKSPRLYQEIFGPGHNAFHLGQVYFILAADVSPDQDGREFRWLTSELQKSQAYKVRLVFLHIPPLDPRGGENRHALSEARGRRLAALLAQYRVTHVFAGHIHGYFTARWDGIPYTITAGGGAPLYGSDPNHYFFHYLEVTVAGDTVRTRVVRLAAGASRD